MGWAHPLIMFVVLIVGVYVLWLGSFRFRALHFGHRVPFNWKRHVRVGSLVLGLWVLGPMTGLLGAQVVWGGVFITSDHLWAGMIMIPLALTGYASGWILDKHKRRRRWLPIAHGVNNLLLVGLSFWQVWTGWDLLSMV